VVVEEGDNFEMNNSIHSLKISVEVVEEIHLIYL
jgi:hypothetical protein